MNDEYHVKVSVKNNLILQAIKDMGYSTVKSFCVANGLDPTRVGGLINFSRYPLNKEGEFTDLAKELMEVLGAAPTDLWTAEQLNLKLSKNSVELTVRQDRLNAILGMNRGELVSIEAPEDIVLKKELVERINESIDILEPRQKEVLELRFGLTDGRIHSMEEVGKKFDVSPERVRQLEVNAIHKLRHPTVANKLKGFINE
jgi:RNA polymerase sigma factor (sigma-70 family)